MMSRWEFLFQTPSGKALLEDTYASVLRIVLMNFPGAGFTADGFSQNGGELPEVADMDDGVLGGDGGTGVSSGAGSASGSADQDRTLGWRLRRFARRRPLLLLLLILVFLALVVGAAAFFVWLYLRMDEDRKERELYLRSSRAGGGAGV